MVGADMKSVATRSGASAARKMLIPRLCLVVVITHRVTTHVRLGVVGVGNIAGLNVAGYLEHDRCDVVALCDPREDALQRRSKEWGVDRLYTRLEDLLADDEIYAVEILTPTHLHKEHVIPAARAGKHVSCQKPMANSVADCRE